MSVQWYREQRRDGSAQIDDNVRINISLDAVIAVLDHFLPNITVPHFCAEVSPFLRRECRLALVRLQRGDGVEDGDVQSPYFRPGVP